MAIKASDNPGDDRPSLKGMPDNPGRDPKVMAKNGRGSIGDTAFMDGIIIIAVAWALVLFLAWSLRSHIV